MDESCSVFAPDSYITLISGDGYEFVVARDLALISPVIRGMLGGASFKEAQTGECHFPDISGIILEIIVKYFHYWQRWKNYDGVVPNMDIPVELCLEVLLAADYLGLDSTSQLQSRA
ncbi:hypothetical protein TD95_003893 [Thielaviopsis punctulata]|uniref:Elongin-C n=1 Tax=Thielaviopsis punctulata TaxID=72032 RepID=A0A0F4ZHZ4_9PEZI|nr:hypothetical protein TD95_003893 [Thielaviopsis punctulata]